ncbi:enoyl-CoA hydratase/carnithine racemase [Saprospira grandis DSM 2844]|uniref:Enoyl-CoA hydratase/carnithine racemase n=1 Tax=Saprospira grandis DSM 2844 TaxID=694433 RepID=J0NYD1_9BACT|nr:enoyl-CoA hydratase-related protein [Saprospira grandis]EJF52524.1 enoyl-CoA hydratase/carnithine racemase [Saprospira grandis DSM 2844]
MTYQNLLAVEENGIITLTINRPKALNALNQQTLKELKQFFGQDALAVEGLKGVVLTGAGPKSFVAGADISEFTGLDAQAGLEMAQHGQDIFFLIEEFKVPVVAAVNGFALGGGCELAMACHLRVASEKARFGQPEVNLGIIPGYGGTQRLIQYLGKTKAIELLMTGDMIKAEEAYRLGLLNYVTPAGEELAKAKELLEKIATKAPIAIQKVIECVNSHFSKGGFEKEVIEFANAVNTEDFKEGASAFLEKRAPNFKGN